MPENLTAFNIYLFYTQIFLHSFEGTRGCRTTEEKVCCNVEPLKLKLQLC